MKNDDKNLKFYLVLLWIFAFLVIIIMITLTVNAQSPYPLPFIVQNENIEDFQNTIDLFNGDAQAQYFYDQINNDNFFGYDYYENGYHYFAFYIPENNFTYSFTLSSDYDVFDYTQDALIMTFSNYKFIKATIKYDRYNRPYWSGSFSSIVQTSPVSIRFFVGSNKGNGSALIPNISSTNYIYDNDEYKVVFGFGNPSLPIDIGVAVIPPNPITPEYLNGDTAPTNVPPSYTINNYTWTTVPTFDGASVINGIQSIKDTLEWLADNLQNSISNLLNNLKGLAEYIGKTIQYYGNAIIETLNNLIQNFYNNMKSLFEPIFNELTELKEDFVEFADLFINPFDEEEFEEQIENCQLITQYQELLDNTDIIREVFANAYEKDSFIIYIDFENPFADSEHKIIHGQISFNWLVPLRSIYRPFLTVFILLECFVGGFRLLGNIIGGKAK